MGRAANDDWPEGQPLVDPDASRGVRGWSDLQPEAQDQIGSALRAFYADLLQQSLPPRLIKLTRKIEMWLETSRHAG